MVSPKVNLFKQRATALKANGIFNFDLRRTPSNYEKRKARELYNKFSDVIANPGKYTKVSVSHETAKSLDISPLHAKTNKKTNVWVKSDGKQVKVNRDKSVTVGKRGKDQIIHTYYVGGKSIFETAEKVFAKLPNYAELVEEGEIDDLIQDVKKYVTVAIGDNMPFHRAMYSMEEFNFYITQWQPHDAKGQTPEQTAALKEKLINRMVSVEIYSPEAFAGETKEARNNAVRIYKGAKGGKKGKGKNSGN